MARLRYDNLSCTGAKPTLGASLTNAGTTITFPAALQSWGVNVPTIVAPDYIPLVLDPLGDPGSSAAAEIVHLTAYTAGATTGTIARGQESSTGVAHANGVPVAHGVCVLDIVGDTAWTTVGGGGGAPAFQNSWGNSGGAGSTTAKFRLTASGIVFVVGVITGGTAGSTAFTLPAGYRPLEQRTLVVWHATGSLAGLVLVLATGEVQPQFTGNIWLDGTTFIAEQ